MALREPIEFLAAAGRARRPVTPYAVTKAAPAEVAAFDQFGRALIADLADHAGPYRVNAAILHFALHFEQVRRSQPRRDEGKLVAVCLTHLATLYDCWLALKRAEFARPPEPSAATLPPAAGAPSLFDAVMTLYETT